MGVKQTNINKKSSTNKPSSNTDTQVHTHYTHIHTTHTPPLNTHTHTHTHYTHYTWIAHGEVRAIENMMAYLRGSYH